MAHYHCNVIILFLSCSFETQRNGLVFIYDMAGSNYTNFELDLSKKILNLLKVRLVIHLCAVFLGLRVVGCRCQGKLEKSVQLFACWLQGAFPARLKKVLIVGAPVWFRVPYNLLSLLLKEKLRERVSIHAYMAIADLNQSQRRLALINHLG